MASENTSPFSLWSDAETEVDLLGFSHIVDAVEHLVKTQHLLPATIGVFGDWGSGKTSILKMCEQRLKADDNTLVLWFNGWLFEGYDHAKASLMERLVEELVASQRSAIKVKKLGIRLLKRINWLRVASSTLKIGGALAVGGPPLAALAASTDLPTLAKAAGEAIDKIEDGELDQYLNDAQSQSFSQQVEGFRQDFEELLSESKVDRLVVLIDDLDRCLPPTIIQTLEAIKLFLSVGNVAFVVGADERLVQYAVRERFPELPGERVDVGRDYLEKLIQYPVRVPALSRSEVQTYIALLFLQSSSDEKAIGLACEWLQKPERSVAGSAFDHEVATTLGIDTSNENGEGLTISAQIGPLLGKGLSGNPRQCKRFLNMLMMRLGMAKSRGVDLSRKLLAKIMILEYLKPELFRLLGDMQAEGHGVPEKLIALQNDLVEAASDKVYTPTIASDLDIWQKDPVAREWLSIEPKLDEADLGPYFYFSRDILTDHGQQVQRMGAAARDVYRKLLSNSDAVHGNGLRDLEKLSFSEASSVLNELFARSRADESVESLKILFAAANKRTDLLGDLLAFLDTVLLTTIPIWAPPRLNQATKDSDYAATTKSLLEKWADGGKGGLATAAARELQRIGDNK